MNMAEHNLALEAYRNRHPYATYLPNVYHKRNGTTITVYADGLRITILRTDWQFVHRPCARVSGQIPVHTDWKKHVVKTRR